MRFQTVSRGSERRILMSKGPKAHQSPSDCGTIAGTLVKRFRRKNSAWLFTKRDLKASSKKQERKK